MTLLLKIHQYLDEPMIVEKFSPPMLINNLKILPLRTSTEKRFKINPYCDNINEYFILNIETQM